MANVTVTMNPNADGKQIHAIHGLHLLSAVANEFLHGNHQRIQELYLHRIESQVLRQGRPTGMRCAPILNINNSTSTAKTSTKIATNGESALSKKCMAELNYIRHRAVPMRRKWMARFLELAAFKKKYGHTKVPHNFPESPKLAEWQVRCISH